MTSPLEHIRVLIADDHQVVRQGLRTFLELQDDIQVVGEASDGLAAVDMARRLAPDVVLMDLVMPGLDGIEATRRIKGGGTNVQVIALTSFTEDDKVFPAIEAGAAAYLLKDVTPEDLVEAIRAARRGEARLHPNIARRLMEQVSHRPTPLPADSPEALTARELDVVRLVAEGKSNLEIAQQLVISDKTVKTHISHILAKLGLQDRTQLAVFAFKHGLTDPRQA